MCFHFYTNLFCRQVYCWGDNDHGQQGNGTTNANPEPRLVTNFSNIKINRIGCGSSQSIAWKCPELPLLMSEKPVKFARIKDSMGVTALSMIFYFFFYNGICHVNQLLIIECY